MNEESYIKEIESALKMLAEKFNEELRGLRSNRPSVELVENIPVTCYDQLMSVKQLGSLSIVPPREIQISVWDKTTMGTVAKAIEEAKIGLSVSVDGGIIRAVLPPLSSDRREELMKLVKKTGESFRIQVRTHRDEIMKKVKAAQDAKELTEDAAFRVKEKIQKVVENGNSQIEKMVEEKLAQLSE